MSLDIFSTKESLVGIGDSDLIRLVYISRPTLKGRFNGHLFSDIQNKATQYNNSQGISGILCYGGGYFFQCLEGTKKTVLDLMERIFKDDNHKVVRVIYAQKAHHHIFSEWRMRCITLDAKRWEQNSTQLHSNALSNYIPFEPVGWTSRKTREFLDVIQEVQSEAHAHANHNTTTVFEVGSKIGYARPPHAKFLIVQAAVAVVAVLVLMTVI